MIVDDETRGGSALGQDQVARIGPNARTADGHMVGERRMAGDAFGPGPHRRRRRIYGRRILGGNLENMSKLLFGHRRSPLACDACPVSEAPRRAGRSMKFPKMDKSGTV